MMGREIHRRRCETVSDAIYILRPPPHKKTDKLGTVTFV